MTSRIIYGARETRSARWIPRVSLKAALIAGAVMVILGAGAVALRLPALQVRDITITGLATVDEEHMRSAIAEGIGGYRFLLFPRSSYFLADTDELAIVLGRAFPAISALRIEKTFPRTLAVAVTERQFWGIMCNNLDEKIVSQEEDKYPAEIPQCIALDTTGFAYESAPRPQGNLILILETDRATLTVGEQHIELSLMERLQMLRVGIKQATGQEVTLFALRERAPSEIHAGVADGFAIYFRRDDDFANAFRVLKKVLDAEIGSRRANLAYIDVRFGNKVFYKFRSNE
ncbi:MAG: hypothetical protein AAB916_01620 [Patescibacteria group bacterium]